MPPFDKCSDRDGALTSTATDVSLMDGLCRKNPGAMAALYDRYSPALFAMCLRSLNDRADAEDLLLDVFLELWERADRYDERRGSPRTYIFGLARSRIVDCLRARGSRRATSGSRASPGEVESRAAPSSDINPLGLAILAESQTRVAAAMRSLSADQRAALEMVYFDAMTHVEISQKLDTPVGTVKSRIRQALTHLRCLLGVTDASADKK